VSVRDEEGTVIGWYGTNTDIEGRKRAEDQQRRAPEGARTRSSILARTSSPREGRTVSMVSHPLQTAAGRTGTDHLLVCDGG
jgi:hypothetical protein